MGIKPMWTVVSLMVIASVLVGVDNFEGNQPNGSILPAIYSSRPQTENEVGTRTKQSMKPDAAFQSSELYGSNPQTEDIRSDNERQFRKIRVGFLMPDEAYFANTAGAIRIAFDRVEKEQLLPSTNWSFHWHIDDCNESVALGYLIKMMKHERIHVILEPPCYNPSLVTAVVAKRYNIPVFSWCTNDIDLADSKRFPSRVSTAASPNRIAQALKDFLIHLNWRRVGIFYSTTTTRRQCPNIIRSFGKLQKSAGLVTVYEASVRSTESIESDVVNYLDNVNDGTRVSVLCLENEKDLEQFMLVAQSKRMTTEEYVYVVLQYSQMDELGQGVVKNGRAVMGPVFQRMIFIETLAKESNLVSFNEEVLRKVQQWPFYYRNKKNVKSNVGALYSPFLHDAFYLYALALSRTLKRGASINHTADIVSNAKNIEFEGQSGTVRIDEFGDRQQNFMVSGFDSAMNMLAMLEIDLSMPNGQKVKTIRTSVELLNSYTKDIPNCVRADEPCDSPSTYGVNWTAAIATSGLIVVLILIAGLVWFSQKKLLASEVAVTAWKIGYNELVWINDRNRLCATLLALTGTTDEGEQLEMGGNANPRVVRCRGTISWTKEHTNVTNWAGRVESWHLKALKNLSHDNVNAFIGLCVELNHPISIWAFNGKGSLDEVIKNEANRLDMVFKCSLMKDLASGMEYLCSSSIKSHGRLKSSNCLIDKRWTLRVTDYGLPGYRSATTDPAELLWTAPEFLRMKNPPMNGNEKGDMYSFGIILQELFDLNRPYWRELLSPDEIISRVRAVEDPPFRPSLHPNATDEGVWSVMKLMCECWDENPTTRPNFRRIKSAIGELRRGTSNLMDYVLKTSEKYASGLEEVVQERMRQYAEEKKKTDQLLCRLLPKMVADALKTGTTVQPECYECSTILFSDVVGFTNLAAKSSPMETVNLLNSLYTLFDDIIAQYDVYKVVTIGDGYMCASGLPTRNGNRHASELAEMSLHVISGIKTFKIPHRLNERLEVRIGIHSGPVVAGVVGITMPRYCVFGDTVNTSNRLEGSGQPSCIHISDVTNEFLTKTIGGFITEPRGEVIIKGRGVIFTYWLVGKTGKNPVNIRKPGGEGSRVAAVTINHEGSAGSVASGKLPQVDAE